MDQATQTMIENLYKNTGKPLEEWIEIVQAQNFSKHGKIVKYLKQIHCLTHGFANLIAHKSKGTDADSAINPNDLIIKQYSGKEHFFPLYNKLMDIITSFGEDVEIAPKNTYVSLRRKKQFAILNPATKNRFEIGLNLKGMDPTVILEAEKPNAMCSHKISVKNIDEVNDKVLGWIKSAYEQAG